MAHPVAGLPRALFICPTFPQRAGNGLSMRAGLWLRFLAARYSLTLLVLPISAGKNTALSEDFCSRCDHVEIIRPTLADRIRGAVSRRLRAHHEPFERGWITDSVTERVYRAVAADALDLIVVHRFYLTRAIRQLLNDKPRRCPVLLDLDDIESVTNARLAELCSIRGDSTSAARYLEQSRIYRSEELECLGLYDRITVCSQGDQALLHRDYGLDQVEVVPNAACGSAVARTQSSARPYTFLFVGNLRYFPNRDAIEYFAEEVLPRIREIAARPFEVVLVGAGLSPAAARALSRHSEIRVVGAVADVVEYYAKADSIIAPLRAGGGTRIKILEAFAYERPVVATSVGIEGIAAEHEREALIADDPEGFAMQCCRLMREPALGDGLVRRAKECYERNYSEQAVSARMAESVFGCRSEPEPGSIE